MPFTFSHPAIMLPLMLKKLRLSATGLIIGSMTPDFEYFIRMKNVSKYSHSIPGLFWFDLPLGVLLCFIYHDIVRNALFDNFPYFLKQRVVVFKKFQWNKFFEKHWMIVVLSLLIGSISHILWDAFTHDTLFFVQKDPELSNIMQVGRVNLAGYKFLQLASSIVGLAVVFIAILALKKRPSDGKVSFKYWILMLVIIGVAMFLRYEGGLDVRIHRRVIVSFISSIIIALILAPLLMGTTGGQDSKKISNNVNNKL